MNLVRCVSILALASVALSARAVVAYSNVDGPYYQVGAFGGGYTLDHYQSVGYRFTSGASGGLTSLAVAVNDGYPVSGQLPFELRLYADDGAGALGTLLGAWSALSTGNPDSASQAYSTVDASGTGIALSAGSAYWLVASSETDYLTWNFVDYVQEQPAYHTNGSNAYYSDLYSGAFTVQVAGVPGPAAALPFALMALKRRKRA